jgi:hypothetical protein
MVNDDTLLINYNYKDDDVCNNSKTSLAVAVFVTSWARLELIRVIDQIEADGLEGRILYMDTDSVIFRYKDGTAKPDTGDYLGNLADEIAKDYGVNAKCTKFCSLGPKVYAMEIWPENVNEPITTIKVKGVTLTASALDLITFQSMIDLAQDYVNNNGDTSKCKRLSIPQMQIRPTKMQTIETKHFDKTFRAMSEKRRINGNDTLPFGYCE